MTERLTPIESIMWRASQDGGFRMVVSDLMILDRAPEQAELRRRIGAAAARAPRLRRRPSDPYRVRGRMQWIEDREFVPADYLRAVALPHPGGQRELLDMLTLLEPGPFDPDRSPWDITLIEGLEGGRAALYLRAHHSLTDGMGGIALVQHLLDQDEPVRPVVTPPAPVAPAAPPAADLEADAQTEADAEAGEDDAGGSGRRPGTITMTIDMTQAAGAAGNVARNVAAAAYNADPIGSIGRAAQRGLDTASSVSRQVVVTGGALSSLPATRSITNHFEVLSVPRAREIALALGGSRNDLLVAASAAAIGSYQERLGLAAGELRLALPARRSRGSASGGNWFAPIRLTVPAGGHHPGPLFGIVSERMARARREPAVPLTGPLASAISVLPSRLLLPALHAQARSVDFVVTSFPGLRGKRTVCGATVEENYPFGPRAETIVNLTGFGIEDRLDIGIALDPNAVAEPKVFVDCLVAAFASFESSAR